jgi:hypothetical protein
MVTRAKQSALALLLSAAVAACDLSEVEVPFGDPIVVVHAVMRPDLPGQFFGQQFVVVERSFTGEVAPVIDPETGDVRFHDLDSLTIPYGGFAPTPMEDATVWVTNVDLPNDPCGNPVMFHPDAALPPALAQPGAVPREAPGVYWSPQDCPTMRPGDRLELRVETPQGEVVTGMTRVPGMREARLAVAGREIVFGALGATTFNRDVDTLRVTVDGQAARLMQLEVRRNGDFTDFGTKIYADTTALTVPANVINTFVIGDEDDVFRPGREYIVTVALTDTNFFDFSRSENSQFTGRGFINRLTGGIGVFGAMVAQSTVVRAEGNVDDPREGSYRLQGTYRDTLAIDLNWRLYLARDTEDAEFSAFVQGRWIYGEIDASVDGRFLGNEFEAVIIDTVGTLVQSDTLRGVRRTGEPWQVVVLDQCLGPVGAERCAGGRPTLFQGTVEQQ